MRKCGLHKTCRICKQIGHNQKACPQATEIHITQLRESQQQRPTEASLQPSPTKASQQPTPSEPSKQPPPTQPSHQPPPPQPSHQPTPT